MEGLQVLTLSGVHGKLDELAHDAQLPWALIKPSVLEFANKLRAMGVFFVFSDDAVTINKLQAEMQVNKGWSVVLPSGSMYIFPCGGAKEIIAAHGIAALGIMWPMAKPHLVKFLTVLYAHNCFVASADDAGTKFLDEKTKEKPLSIRIKGE